MVGLAFTSVFQHPRSSSFRYGGQLYGMTGRRPRCTTPTAAFMGVMSLYGTSPVKSSQMSTPNEYTSARQS